MLVADVRKYFRDQLAEENFVIDKTGVKTIEMISASFIADEPAIFGEVNWDYVDREISWYNSKSLNVKDIPGKTPQIWEQVSDENGFINSNYGWCIYSADNGNQYKHVLNELKHQPNSRRAVMIYNRPSMHVDYMRNGMSDFMCTNTVQYVIRNDYLHAIVQMRSNDVVFGYKNDRAWQDYVLNALAADLNLQVGNIYWNVGSLHVYERHFNLLA